MDLALSTSWAAFRYTDALKMLFEIQKLGFSAVELSFNLSASMVDAIVKAHSAESPRVVSVHNYCPFPEKFPRVSALPDCYSLASSSQEERLLAIAHTKKSIDTASLVGAKAVVLHCGRVEIPDHTRELIALFDSGAETSARFRELKDRIIEERRNSVRPFLDNTLKSLEVLEAYAGKKGIYLGLETRYYYREIPSLEETGSILDTFKGSHICYWHDTGHAQVMQNLGFARHLDYLDLYGDRLIGIHLHDVIGCLDHIAPSKGNLDFSIFKPYIKEDTLGVIEAHYPATAQELLESKKYISDLFYG